MPSPLTFGLALPPPLDAAKAKTELVGLGRLVVFLVEGSPVFDYDDSVLAVLEDGGFMGMVQPDGTLSFPAMDPVDAASLVPDGLELQTLTAASG